MVATKHCSWGKCTSDSRYPDKLPITLKNLQESGENVFLSFPKPSKDLEKCQRWVNACSRQNFSVSNVTKDTYICKAHWPGGKGPTVEFPDPLKANLSQGEKTKASRKRRKPPCRATEQQQQQSKRLKTTDLDPEVHEENANKFASIEDTSIEPNNEKSTQTDVKKYELSCKIESAIIRNELLTSGTALKTKVLSTLSFELVSKNPDQMKHFTNLSPAQFEILYDFLNDVCPLETITYWGRKGKITQQVKFRNAQWSLKEKLYICLLRLKTGFTIKTLSFLLSTPDRQIKESFIRVIFTTFLQLMYKIFRDMEEVMFPSRKLLSRFLPRVFKTLKKVRCSIDCTEFRVETSRNFSQQGNTYSSYKHSNTFKCLIACTPNGGACFVSDLFEGDISDVDIFEKSGIIKHIQPGDIILADRGFTVQDCLYPLQAKVKIPAFLKGRKSLSAREELDTRVIAKARIHIERYNQRIKQFKLVGRKIPLSLAPLATQMVVVACGLVNFQEVLCK